VEAEYTDCGREVLPGCSDEDSAHLGL